MDSSNIKPHQAAQMRLTIARSLRYLGKLRARMEQLGFPPSDELYRSVSRAHDTMQEVHVRCHYMACTSGVGRANDAYGGGE